MNEKSAGTLSSMKKPVDTSARITSLRRYIGLLHLVEKRLKWVLGNTAAHNPEHADAQRDVKVISDKLRKAERELSDLELPG